MIIACTVILNVVVTSEGSSDRPRSIPEFSLLLLPLLFRYNLANLHKKRWATEPTSPPLSSWGELLPLV